MPGLTKNDLRGLWAILWRTVVFVPFLWIIGLVLMALVIGAFVALPVYAGVSIYMGDWRLGIAALLLWIVVLRFRNRILTWAFEGIQYASI